MEVYCLQAMKATLGQFGFGNKNILITWENRIIAIRVFYLKEKLLLAKTFLCVIYYSM